MASAWIEPNRTPSGQRRYRVKYRLGGREARSRYAGQFTTKREAAIRQQWVAGELAARRVPDLAALREPELTPTLEEAAKPWRDSRALSYSTIITSRRTSPVTSA